MHSAPRLRAASKLVVLASSLMLLPTANARAQVVVTFDQHQWATHTNGAYISWPQADAYCANLTLGEHNDWRLPTVAELETLHDPGTASGIRSPIRLENCCLWSSTSLEEIAAEDGDEQVGRPGLYRWGFMFDGGHHYYAGRFFDDGEALCIRDR